MRLLAVAIGALLTKLTVGIISVRKKVANTSDPVVGGVHVAPPNFEDYARGRTPLALFARGEAPGAMQSYHSLSSDVPSFNAVDPDSTPELYTLTPQGDPINMRCSPGGEAYGHYFYDVVDPEIVPFIVPQDQPGRTDMVVVVAPGGGNLHLAWEPSGIGVAEWFNSIGISAYVVKYRVPDFTSEAQRMDVQRAISMARHDAAQHGLNASRVGFMGCSASGGLALRVATTDERLYARIDDIDDVSFKPDFLITLFPGDSGFMTPELAAKMPIHFLSHAADDPCVPAPSMHLLARKMEQYATKPFFYHEYPEGRHAWATCEYYPDKLMGMEMCNWKQLAEAFLRKEVLGVQ